MKGVWSACRFRADTGGQPGVMWPVLAGGSDISITSRVDGHQDLPSNGHEVGAMAITESDRIRSSSRREICSADYALHVDSGFSVAGVAQNCRFWRGLLVKEGARRRTSRLASDGCAVLEGFWPAGKLAC
jgi:hypothetical protein